AGDRVEQQAWRTDAVARQDDGASALLLHAAIPVVINGAVRAPARIYRDLAHARVRTQLHSRLQGGRPVGHLRAGQRARRAAAVARAARAADLPARLMRRGE